MVRQWKPSQAMDSRKESRTGWLASSYAYGRRRQAKAAANAAEGETRH